MHEQICIHFDRYVVLFVNASLRWEMGAIPLTSNVTSFILLRMARAISVEVHVNGKCTQHMHTAHHKTKYAMCKQTRQRYARVIGYDFVQAYPTNIDAFWKWKKPLALADLFTYVACSTFIFSIHTYFVSLVFTAASLLYSSRIQFNYIEKFWLKWSVITDFPISWPDYSVNVKCIYKWPITKPMNVFSITQ